MWYLAKANVPFAFDPLAKASGKLYEEFSSGITFRTLPENE